MCVVSANDQYNIHLLKHVRVARLRDMVGTDYSVPINSSIEFGLVFDPVEESRVSQQALSGTYVGRWGKDWVKGHLQQKLRAMSCLFQDGTKEQFLKKI